MILSNHLLQLFDWVPSPCMHCLADTDAVGSSITLGAWAEWGGGWSRHNRKTAFSIALKLALFVGSEENKHVNILLKSESIGCLYCYESMSSCRLEVEVLFLYFMLFTMPSCNILFTWWLTPWPLTWGHVSSEVSVSITLSLPISPQLLWRQLSKHQPTHSLRHSA